MTTIKHKELLEKFIHQLDENKFYDAHESLEEIWFPRRFEGSDEVKLLKGFINAAVCFELIKKGRKASSEKVWKNYLKYKPLLHTLDSEYTKEYNTIVLYVEKIKASYI
ncbi:DUF309 domain-containing protein [Candidatus Sulfurimonas marisnigri]|uniref:DUF309 domain-containing protein n=1 Tax=Candidatus Sulfurimonas marisnigri TaxID=2740405 RepID=A0A7S7M193_9BACT|nr:DUF309 domain-containing protein [Candidatus Sulfurimonas marisnigri]QOY54723.1 DUF309 domain-containing protein [Candidatus Sulfurimonas marisnigri]